MIAWQISAPCKLLQHFSNSFYPPKSVLSTHQCLKPIESISVALQQNRVDGDLVYLLPSDPTIKGASRKVAMGFSISEACQPFGGFETVKHECALCPANIDDGPPSDDTPTHLRQIDPQVTVTKQANFGSSACSWEPAARLAGCSQILFAGNLEEYSRQTQDLSTANKPLPRPNFLAFDLRTWNPSVRRLSEFLFDDEALGALTQSTTAAHLWYNLWAGKAISGPLLDRLIDVLQPIEPDTFVLDGLTHFVEALSICQKNQWDLKLQFVPQGFSDGHDWWIAPHCNRCHGPMAEQSTKCLVCGYESGPVPGRKRRIMGWAPYMPLDALLGSQAANQV